MNPKKRFHQILSVILTAAMLFSPAAFAQAGEMVIVPDYGEMTYEQANALFPEDYVRAAAHQDARLLRKPQDDRFFRLENLVIRIGKRRRRQEPVDESGASCQILPFSLYFIF